MLVTGDRKLTWAYEAPWVRRVCVVCRVRRARGSMGLEEFAGFVGLGCGVGRVGMVRRLSVVRRACRIRVFLWVCWLRGIGPMGCRWPSVGVDRGLHLTTAPKTRRQAVLQGKERKEGREKTGNKEKEGKARKETRSERKGKEAKRREGMHGQK
jgi:hypothetical protein